MCADPFALKSSSSASDAQSVPFASEWVTLTRQEHIELVMQAHFFQSMHERAVVRAAWREDRYQKVLRQMKERCELREAALQVQLQEAQARIRDLQQRLFGSKTERRPGNERQGRLREVHAPRGQRRGAPGHGRAMHPSLPARHEFV